MLVQVTEVEYQRGAVVQPCGASVVQSHVRSPQPLLPAGAPDRSGPFAFSYIQRKQVVERGKLNEGSVAPMEVV